MTRQQRAPNATVDLRKHLVYRAFFAGKSKRVYYRGAQPRQARNVLYIGILAIFVQLFKLSDAGGGHYCVEDILGCARTVPHLLSLPQFTHGAAVSNCDCVVGASIIAPSPW